MAAVQIRMQQLAPLLVQAQFDMNSEAGKKITAIWATLVSVWSAPTCFLGTAFPNSL